MLIEISPETVGSLRLINRLRLGAVTQLEGYNGVGKSSAIRLLLVCVGKNPYPDNEQAWRTFRAGLGKVSVSVTELGEGKPGELRWTFDARAWPDHQRIADDWFEQISLDGQPATLADIAAAFNVERFTGESGITETFSAELNGHRQSLLSLAEKLTESERDRHSPEAGAQEALESLVGLTQHLTPDALDADRELLEQAAGSLARAAEAADNAAEQAEELQLARELEAGLQQLAAVEPELRSSLAVAESDIERLEVERAELTARLAALPSGLDKRSQLELARAQKNLEKNRGLLDSASIALADLLASAGLSDIDGMKARTPEVQAIRRQLVAQIANLSLNPDTSLLAQQGAQLLRTRVALLDQQILPTGYAEDATVAALAGALDARARELDGFPDPEELATLKARLERLDEELRQYETIRAASLERDRIAALVEKHSLTIEALSNDSADSNAAEALRTQSTDLDRGYAEAVQRRASKRHQLDVLLQGGDAGARQARLSELLDKHGIQLNQLDASLHTALQRKEEDRGHLNEAESEHRAISEAFEDRNRRLASAVRQLASKQFDWLPAALRVDPKPRTLANAARQVTAIHFAAELALARLTTLSDNFLAAGAAFGELASAIVQPTPSNSTSSRRYIEKLTAWAQREFAEYFSQPPIRDNLLGSDASDVEVDIGTASVRWVAGNNVVSRRLDTFSSGEQAFAYARARIGLLDASASPSVARLICLDEFGAFMDFDRRNALVSFLKDRSSSHPSDCVLLVLPLRRDIEAESLAAIGSERDALLAMKKDLESQGYVLESLT